MSAALLEVDGLGVHRGGRTVLQGLSLRLEAGERLWVRGASGSGKTTLLHALLGFVSATGNVRWFGRPMGGERDYATVRGPVGLLFQDPDDQLLGPTVLEDVMFGPLNLGRTPADARALAGQVLAGLGITPLAGRPVFELSGGEQRLAALAGVLAMAPRVLLLDEPTTGLDDDACTRVIDALAGCGLPMIVASHDPACGQRLATRTLALQRPAAAP